MQTRKPWPTARKQLVQSSAPNAQVAVRVANVVRPVDLAPMQKLAQVIWTT